MNRDSLVKFTAASFIIAHTKRVYPLIVNINCSIHIQWSALQHESQHSDTHNVEESFGKLDRKDAMHAHS